MQCMHLVARGETREQDEAHCTYLDSRMRTQLNDQSSEGVNPARRSFASLAHKTHASMIARTLPSLHEEKRREGLWRYRQANLR